MGLLSIATDIVKTFSGPEYYFIRNIDCFVRFTATACSEMEIGRRALKTREWKTRHQTAVVENAGVEKYGKPKVPVI